MYRAWEFGSISSDGWLMSVEDKFAPLRMQLADWDESKSLNALVRGETGGERRAYLKERGLDRPWGWGLESTAISMMSKGLEERVYSSVHTALLRVDAGGEALAHYGALLAAKGAAVGATQPFSVVQTVQAAQLHEKISFIDAWRSVQENDKKSFYDGVGARLLHSCTHQVLKDAAKAALYTASSVPRPYDNLGAQGEQASHADVTLSWLRSMSMRSVLDRTARFIADVATLPLAAVCWRMEAAHANDALIGYDSAKQCFDAVVARADTNASGWRALFAGVDHLARGYALDMLLTGSLLAVGYAAVSFVLRSPSVPAAIPLTLSVTVLGGEHQSAVHSLAQAELAKNDELAAHYSHYAAQLEAVLAQTHISLRNTQQQQH